MFGESRGGVDVLARRHAVALEQSGSRVVLVYGSEAGQGGVSRVVHVPATRFLVGRHQPRSALPFLVLLNEFVNVIRGSLVASVFLDRESFDLVVSNHSITTLLIRLLHPRAAVVQYVHDGLHAHRHVRGAMGKTVRYLLNDVLEYVSAGLAQHVFCASDGIRDQLVELGLLPSKLTVVPPLLMKAGAPTQVATESSIDSREFQSFTPYILSVGQQSGRKRFDVIICAMKEVSPETTLVLVGDGPLHDSYVRLVREEGLENRVVFSKGTDETTLRALYSNAALFVLVSENEGFPVTVAEALSFGGRALVASPSVATWPESPHWTLVTIPEIPTPGRLAVQVNGLLRNQPKPDYDPNAPVDSSTNLGRSSERAVLAEYLKLLRKAVTSRPSVNSGLH
ncbi:MAG: glycosyltransferase [Thermoplasmata archaeon]|nr:glycosyltransferase [Thermoplasmata archaeon]